MAFVLPKASPGLAWHSFNQRTKKMLKIWENFAQFAWNLRG